MAAPFQRFKHIVDIAETGARESVLDIVRALLGCQEIVFEITEFKHAQWDAALVPGAVNQRRQVAQASRETEIERRNAPGYDTAAGLLLDLKAIAEERGTVGEFAHRLQAIHERHIRKGRFIERLKPIGSHGTQ
ncbi:hypothetical protein L2449_01630 [Mesorhizobium muleiense]|uniref:hypothetical protein n=1 Tax=Mesorhizobium muleiense TaxID=1004279 RepID=UPI001F3D217F|nr:hypothetical protein [Mesorhizobium muleiense]MCF6115631.1 hypothetical protein [Mesorhizobium muleiense]